MQEWRNEVRRKGLKIPRAKMSMSVRLRPPVQNFECIIFLIFEIVVYL